MGESRMSDTILEGATIGLRRDLALGRSPETVSLILLSLLYYCPNSVFLLLILISSTHLHLLLLWQLHLLYPHAPNQIRSSCRFLFLGTIYPLESFMFPSFFGEEEYRLVILCSMSKIHI